MKKMSTLTIVAVMATATSITLSSFSPPRKKQNVNPPVSAYAISLQSKQMVGTDEEWTWVLTNPNPGNGQNGTLQNVSHWSMALPPQAEEALVDVAYSYDGTNWHSLPVEVERDPSIRLCTTIDVLKFNVGTNGDEPVYYKAKFNKKFNNNPYATSYIKTGGGLAGCNMYFFAGLSGTERFD